MAYGPTPARMAHARDSIAQWATTAGLELNVDFQVDYLGARGGYVIVSVAGLPVAGDIEAIVSPQGKVRVFTCTSGGVMEVNQLAAHAAA